GFDISFHQGSLAVVHDLMDLFQQTEPRKTRHLYTHKGYVWLGSRIIDHLDKFVACMVEILFAFFSLYTIIQDRLYMVLRQFFCHACCFLECFAANKLFKNGIPDDPLYRQANLERPWSQAGACFYKPGFSHHRKKKPGFSQLLV